MVLLILIGTVIIAFLWVLSVYFLEVCSDPEIETGYCAVDQLTIAYRMTRNRQICKDYRLLKLLPKSGKIKSISICYSNGPSVDARKQYEVLSSSEVYAVGVILSEEGSTVPDEDSALAAKLGYKIFTFPSITHAVTACYPVKSLISKTSAIQHVYPVLQQIINLCWFNFGVIQLVSKNIDFHASIFVETLNLDQHRLSSGNKSVAQGFLAFIWNPTEAHHLCAYPRFEIYDKSGIQVIIPLSRQISYFVPEVVPPSPYEWYLSNARPCKHVEQKK